MLAGPGDDTIYVDGDNQRGSRSYDAVDCGPGHDVVHADSGFFGDTGDPIKPPDGIGDDCESDR